MNKNSLIFLLIVFFGIGLFTSCREEKTCASAISEMLANGCRTRQLSKIMGLPESVIKKPSKHTFTEADSVLLFSLLNTYNETGKLPENLYHLYNKNKRNQVLEVIENFRQEELKSNNAFVNNLCKIVSDTQKENLNNFIESEINSFKSLRFIWKSQDEINQSLCEALPKYLNEVGVAKMFNDSCAAYFNYISRFRDNGIKRYITKISSQKHLQTIETDVRGFVPQYQFDNSATHVTYQILATIDRAQDVLFAPINWILEFLPGWLMIVIAIILLVFFIFGIFTRNMPLTILDFILLIISAVVFIWGDPYSEIRESLNVQVQTYYEDTINKELTHLNYETNKYYDNLIKIIKINNHAPAAGNPSGMQTVLEKNNGGGSRTNIEKCDEDSDRTRDQNSGEVNSEADNIERSETSIAEGN